MSAYLAQMLAEAGVPVVRNAFLKPQAPPYIVYVFSHSDNFAADSKVYLKRDNYQVELYTEKKDTALEETLEGFLMNTALCTTRPKPTSRAKSSPRFYTKYN